MPRGVRNVAIIAAIAAVVAFVPHGGSSAGFVGTLLTIVLNVLFALFAVQLYRQFRTDIYGLGDRHRLILYASIGAFVLAMAGRDRLTGTGPGTLLLIVMIAGALAGLFVCFTRWRAYRL